MRCLQWELLLQVIPRQVMYSGAAHMFPLFTQGQYAAANLAYGPCIRQGKKIIKAFVVEKDEVHRLEIFG